MRRRIPNTGTDNPDQQPERNELSLKVGRIQAREAKNLADRDAEIGTLHKQLTERDSEITLLGQQTAQHVATITQINRELNELSLEAGRIQARETESLAAKDAEIVSLHRHIEQYVRDQARGWRVNLAIF